MFALQTADGVFNVACIGGTSAQECDSTAASLKLKGGEALGVGPDDAFAQGLGGLLGKLDKARTAGRKGLANAGDNKAQAKAASKVSAAYAAAAKSLSGLTAHPSDLGLVDLFSGAFSQSKAAYANMAAGARKNSRPAYVRGQGAVRNAEKDVKGAIKALQAAGYKVEG